MKYVILASHGKLAYGMHSVLDMFVGVRDEVKSICLEDGMSTDDYKINFKQLIKNIKDDDEIYLFVDILGGSPITMSIEILSENNLIDNSSIFSGMNVPMCLTTVLSKDSMDRNTLEEVIIAEAKTGIQCYKGCVEDEEEL